MACVSELGGNSVGVAPVDGGLGGTCEEVGRVSGQGDGSARAHDLLLSLDLHHLVADLDLGDRSIAGADEQISIRKQLHAVDALREQSVAWADAFEEAALKVNLDDIASQSAEVSAGIVRSDDDALVNSLDLAHGEVLEENFLLAVVDVPDADAVVMDGDDLLAGVVEEADLVGNVHAHIMTADGISTFSLI